MSSRRTVGKKSRKRIHSDPYSIRYCRQVYLLAQPRSSVTSTFAFYFNLYGRYAVETYQMLELCYCWKYTVKTLSFICNFNEYGAYEDVIYLVKVHLKLFSMKDFHRKY